MDISVAKLYERAARLRTIQSQEREEIELSYTYWAAGLNAIFENVKFRFAENEIETPLKFVGHSSKISAALRTSRGCVGNVNIVFTPFRAREEWIEGNNEEWVITLALGNYFQDRKIQTVRKINHSKDIMEAVAELLLPFVVIPHEEEGKKRPKKKEKSNVG